MANGTSVHTHSAAYIDRWIKCATSGPLLAKLEDNIQTCIATLHYSHVSTSQAPMTIDKHHAVAVTFLFSTFSVLCPYLLLYQNGQCSPPGLSRHSGSSGLLCKEKKRQKVADRGMHQGILGLGCGEEHERNASWPLGERGR